MGLLLLLCWALLGSLFICHLGQGVRDETSGYQMRKLSSDRKSSFQDVGQDLRWGGLLVSDDPKSLPDLSLLFSLLSAPRCLCPQPCGQAWVPCLLILPGCDLERLQTQPWVWLLALWPGCKVQGVQDLWQCHCLKGPQALPGCRQASLSESESPLPFTPLLVLFPVPSGESQLACWHAAMLSACSGWPHRPPPCTLRQLCGGWAVCMARLPL